MEVRGQFEASAALTPQGVIGTYLVGGWMDPRVGPDGELNSGISFVQPVARSLLTELSPAPCE
jgi:hypothetical protein